MRSVRAAFPQVGFVAPVMLVLAGMGPFALIVAAAAVQYSAFVLERWYFLDQASHPLYYQCAS
jgi:hypothetical protein